MKKKIVMFGLNAREMKRLSTFPGSTEFDLFAAMNRQQLVETMSVTAIDLLIVQFDDAMLKRYGNVLAALVLNCDKVVVLNTSHVNRSKVTLMFGEKPVRVFDKNDTIAFWDFMIERMSKWQSEQTGVLRKKMALLIDSEAAFSSPYSSLLLRNNFNVVYSAFSSAEDELLENQYDLVLAKAETPCGDSISALDPLKRGFNKNTPFLFVTKSKQPAKNSGLVFSESDDLSELEFCVKKFGQG